MSTWTGSRFQDSRFQLRCPRSADTAMLIYLPKRAGRLPDPELIQGQEGCVSQNSSKGVKVV